MFDTSIAINPSAIMDIETHCEIGKKVEPVDVREDLPSCSNLYDQRGCLGRFQAEKPYKKQQSSKAIDKGCNVHRGMFVGNYANMTLDEKDECIMLLRKRIDLAISWKPEYEAMLASGQLKEEREVRFWMYDPKTGNKILSGGIDYILHDIEDAFVTDYKTGFSEIDPADENQQLLGYAVIAKLNYPNIKRVRVAILHPYRKPTICDYDLEALEAAHGGLLRDLRIMLSPNPPRTAGAWCTTCTAKLNCATAIDAIKKSMELQIVNIPDEELDAKADLFAAARSIGEAFEDHHKARIRAGVPTTKYKWQKGATTRSIENPQEAADKLAPEIELDDLIKLLKLSVPQLETLARTKLGMSKEKAAEWLQEKLGETIKTRKGEDVLKKL